MHTTDVATESPEDLFDGEVADPHFEDVTYPQESRPSEDPPARASALSVPPARSQDHSETTEEQSKNAEEDEHVLSHVHQRRHRAHERLAELRLEEETVRQQAHDLDILQRKQSEFTEGKRELSARLGKACGRLSRDLREGERRIEFANTANHSLRDHLIAVEKLIPEEWDESRLHTELDYALGIIEEARTEYDRQDARLTPMGLSLGSNSVLGGNILPAQKAGLPDFKSLFLAGLYFSLPIALFALVITAAVLWKLA